MTDAEYLFRREVSEKKSIAKSAFKKNLTGKGAVRMPSDFLTEKERQDMNGEVQSYNLSKPMRYGEFKKLSQLLQVEYLEGLDKRFRPTNRMLGKMFGVSDSNVWRIKNELKIAPLRGHGRSKDSPVNREEWEEWLAENGFVEPKFVEPERENKFTVSEAEFTVTGTPDEIALLLRVMFGSDSHAYFIALRR